MRISDWSSDVGPSDLEIVGRKKIEIEAPSRRHLPLLISNLHGVRDRHQFRHHDAGLSLRGRLRHSRAKIGRARKCKTDEQDHSDNSDDYVRHNTPITKGRESSTPALLKTRHSARKTDGQGKRLAV